ncbi:hypothetical protein TGDOM2_301415 [Toxoplasma gondii GAB2-2007-GAL-DOM2]|uniref:Uncharacterized protein n=3 Tax=Toxoplasma gondii TaxID=5811 RepID=A0A086PSY7_TOXGO|nr:hypothetical protein TGDOM2_301415 [Toxoplasma gondii GAB2-2007-GAL-DOM2]KFG35187.1 hypothetical protein TGFOU_301415 [Toxoplasma gondii FOU]KFH03469.1 hypothetical protein TGMAS_301415 [Toxoplasma gondii MAS]
MRNFRLLLQRQYADGIRFTLQHARRPHSRVRNLRFREIHGEVCFQEQLLVLGKVRFMYVSERSGERLLCAPTSCLPRDFFVRLPVDPGTIFPRTADKEPKEPAEAHFYKRDLKPITTERTRSLVASCVGTVPFECRRH